MNKPDPHHAAPTWENQLWHARRLATDKGLDALNNPHAMTGRVCGCGSCFCCAALFVYNELRIPPRSAAEPPAHPPTLRP